MADWVHCNVCNYQPGQLPKREFQLTSCGHIFCLCCERTGPIEQCKMCRVKCTTVHLSAQMAPEVMVYFEEPEDTFEKALKVLRFQKSHSKRLNEFYRTLVEKYSRAKVHIQQVEHELRNARKELEIYKSRHSTNIMTPPPTIPQQPLFSNNSKAFKMVQMGSSQTNPLNNPLNNSPLFATPSRVHSYTSQQYRNQSLTPATPESNTSSSPASLASGSYRRNQNGVGRSNISQYSYKSLETPPINSLRMMYVRTPQSRKN